MEALRKNYKKIFTLKTAKNVVFLLILALSFEFILFPMPSLASQAMEESNINENNSAIAENIANLDDGTINVMEFNGKLPQSKDEIQWSDKFVITAYNSEPGQTDNSPCITANGFDVCKHGTEDTIAANFLPFGSKVKIPELFGDRIFIVRDRTNKRFTNRVDIWMVERPDALKFGVKVAKIQVLE